MDWAALLAAIRLRPIVINALGLLLAVFLRQGIVESSTPIEAIYALFAAAYLGVFSSLASAAAAWLAQLRAGRVDDELERVEPIIDRLYPGDVVSQLPLLQRLEGWGGRWKGVRGDAWRLIRHTYIQLRGEGWEPATYQGPLGEAPPEWSEIRDLAFHLGALAPPAHIDPEQPNKETSARKRIPADIRGFADRIRTERITDPDRWDGFAARVRQRAWAFEILPAVAITLGVPLGAIVASPVTS